MLLSTQVELCTSDRSSPPPQVVTIHKPENSKLMRWALALQPFSFPIQHQPRKLNVATNFLSQMREEEEEARTTRTNRTSKTVVKHGVKGISGLEKVRPSQGGGRGGRFVTAPDTVPITGEKEMCHHEQRRKNLQPDHSGKGRTMPGTGNPGVPNEALPGSRQDCT